MSENLTRLAHRIDFSETDGVSPSPEKAEVPDAESKELISFQPSLWPWDSVRSKLRNAFQEVSVLLDVLNIAKERKYMVLDHVVQESMDFRPAQALAAKKKALATTALIILNGAERLKTSQDTQRNRSADFHTELMAMRQNWRMRKQANSIVGDLSYRSAGSRYQHPGTFEISKNEMSTSSKSSPGTSPVGVPRPCALKVTVPPDLEGNCYIHVSIQKSSDTLNSTDLTVPVSQNTLAQWELSWQQKLEFAHNVLFCKELFSQLAREAVQVQLPIATLVMNNQIVATLFPGVQLSIGLCHTAFPNKNSKSKEASSAIPRGKEHPKPVLEHSLHQLLREVHHNALHHPMPHPTTATLGISRKRYLAGPEAHDKQTIIESCRSETMLEQIIAQSQHVVLRMRTLHMIDTLSREVQDPLIVAHWTNVNSPTTSTVRLNISSYGYETLSRTPLVIHVGATTLKAVSRDGRVFHMSYESQELRYLILSQVL